MTDRLRYLRTLALDALDIARALERTGAHPGLVPAAREFLAKVELAEVRERARLGLPPRREGE